MNRKISIVLIEDDTDDVELLQESLEGQNVLFEMTVIKDGSSAANFFQSTSVFPDIIVMDFNLPKLHGKEVITLIRSDSRFDHIPILILSTSSAKEEISFAYKAGADCYLVKPTTIESIRNTVNTIVDLASGKVPSNHSHMGSSHTYNR